MVPDRWRITIDVVVAPVAVKRTPAQQVAVRHASRGKEHLVAAAQL
jgi:hypothetical protein